MVSASANTWPAEEPDCELESEDDAIERYVERVCKRGQGAECCKYLLMGVGWECAKTSGAKLAIDLVWNDTHTAQGDNCKGHRLQLQ